MKNISLIILILIVSVNLKAQNLETIRTYHDPYYRTKIFEVYTVIKNTPTKQGSYKSYDETGALYEEYNMNRGLKHGVCKRYYTPMYAANFTSEPSAYMNKLYEVANYSNGELNGELKRYVYPNNVQKPIYEATYVRDVMIKEVQYHENGKKKSSYQTNGICYEWYENGRLSYEGNMVNNKEEGKVKYYYENGAVFKDGIMKNGAEIGQWNQYYQSGKIAVVTIYDDSHKIISDKQYFENNTLKLDFKIQEDGNIILEQYDSLTNILIFKSNLKAFEKYNGQTEYKKDGEEIKYYPNGNIEYRKHYNDDLLNGINEEYHKNGNLKLIKTYSKNLLDGDYMEYFQDGKIKLKGTYMDNRESGIWVNYFPDGTIQEYNVKNNTGKYLLNYENGKPRIRGQFNHALKDGEWEYYDNNGIMEKYEKYQSGTLYYSLNAKEIEKQNKKKATEKLYDENQEMFKKVEEAYTQNKLSSDKKIIYECFMISYTALTKELNSLRLTLMVDDTHNLATDISLLLSKMIDIKDKETKELSKSLRKIRENPNEILKIILEYK